ncbi:hypothetical protein PVAP13_2NG256030 [Panicum virgatum]|uniref:Uncharacterized protein n=1 Tax=Panicum virgatum TaxID=38727 RepID=A0A8T0VK03_PANVG|nr:hypothetical protein PVAP13_2NG256030 [Panicum virgatum]
MTEPGGAIGKARGGTAGRSWPPGRPPGRRAWRAALREAVASSTARRQQVGSTATRARGKRRRLGPRQAGPRDGGGSSPQRATAGGAAMGRTYCWVVPLSQSLVGWI